MDGSAFFASVAATGNAATAKMAGNSNGDKLDFGGANLRTLPVSQNAKEVICQFHFRIRSKDIMLFQRAVLIILPRSLVFLYTSLNTGAIAITIYLRMIHI